MLSLEIEGFEHEKWECSSQGTIDGEAQDSFNTSTDRKQNKNWKRRSSKSEQNKVIQCEGTGVSVWFPTMTWKVCVFLSLSSFTYAVNIHYM